ncbi:hypothetical protein [Telluribacter sp.]|jgi:hypothetical protein|uniref:hypothetical protein n=1 Tax=Telluribacter sp. TaxID=1978767 RepID=UPI002E1647F9|nr:hypothetical protein [Telluribacter sp.]
MSCEQFSDELFADCRSRKSVKRYFSFGPHRVTLCFQGAEGLRTFFTKAIAHLEQEAGPAALTVWVLDRASSGIMLPQPAWDWNQMDGYGTIAPFPTERYYANFQQASNTFTLLDRNTSQAVIWMNDVNALPEWERSFPLRSVLYEWLRESSSLFLHAGAVGTDTGGVLLTGRGGSGKSTSTLACLGSDLKYIGDDFVMVNTESLDAYSLYNVAKLEWDQLLRFPTLEPLIYNTSARPHEKAQLFVWDHYPDKVSQSIPLKAILLPRFTGLTDTTIEPATGAEVLRALVPSTLALLKAPPAYLTKIRMLIQQLPCYWLLTGTDLGQIPQTIQKLLTELQTVEIVGEALPAC